jgi:hypothetical protein
MDTTVLDHIEDMIPSEPIPVESDETRLELSLTELDSTLEKVKASLMLKKASLDAFALKMLGDIGPIENDNTLSETRKSLRAVSGRIKEIEELRLNTTRPLDAFKKRLMEVQHDICTVASDLHGSVSVKAEEYERKEARRKEEERKKLELERLIEIQTKEAREYGDRMININANALLSEARNSLTAMASKATLETIDKVYDNINRIQPKLSKDVWDGLFAIDYTHFDALVPEALDGLLDEQTERFPYATVTNVYKTEIEKVKAEIIAGKAQAIQNLKDGIISVHADTFDKNKEAERAAVEASARLEVLQSLSKESVALETGAGNVKKSLVEVECYTIEGYKGLLSFFMQNGGDVSKLDFLKAYAKNNGQPKINGVKYVV